MRTTSFHPTHLGPEGFADTFGYKGGQPLPLKMATIINSEYFKDLRPWKDLSALL